MKIFLIGFMGCGKSTIGKKLAGKMGYEFIDLDHQFEKAVGSSINKYFESNGEEAFRMEESKLLKSYDYPANCIIATGGGTPCFFDNIDWINRNGLSVYIQMTPTALADRLENGKAKRPLLKDLNKTEVVAFITHKLAERTAYYEQASVTIAGMDLTVEHLRAKLFEAKED